MATITGTLKFVTNDNAALSVNFIPKSTPKADGSNIVAGTKKMVITDANGAIPSTVLLAGKYAVQLGNGEEFDIDVPAGAGTYDLSAIVDSSGTAADTSTYVRRQFSQNTDGSVVSNTTTETTLIGAGQGSLSLPANFMVLSKKLFLTARGILYTPSSSPTLTIRLKLGGSIYCSISLTPPNNLVNQPWLLDAWLNCKLAGASGEGRASMYFTFQSAAGTAVIHMSNSSTIALDTTAVKVLDLTAQWGGADVGAQINSTIVCVEAIP